LSRDQYEALVDNPDALVQHSHDVIQKLIEKISALEAGHAADLLAARTDRPCVYLSFLRLSLLRNIAYVHGNLDAVVVVVPTAVEA
jgi:hypothetical protein